GDDAKGFDRASESYDVRHRRALTETPKEYADRVDREASDERLDVGGEDAFGLLELLGIIDLAGDLLAWAKPLSAVNCRIIRAGNGEDMMMLIEQSLDREDGFGLCASSVEEDEERRLTLRRLGGGAFEVLQSRFVHVRSG